MIYSEVPAGYRWAEPHEVDKALCGMIDFIQIRVGGTDDEPWTDLAVKDN